MNRNLHPWRHAASLILLLCFTCSCTPTTTVPVVTCPPLVNTHIATIPSSTDLSSITVSAGTYAYQEPYTSSNQIPWCDADANNNLGIQPYPVSSLASLPSYNNVLAAVDIKPDAIKFPVAANRPQLSFNLKPGTYNLDPKNCGNSSCYAFYRYTGSSWVYAGSATAVPISSNWFAQGPINHFSLYALVELPPPQTLPGPQNLGLVVASDFLGDEQGSMSVAFMVRDDSLGQLNAGTPELVFRFFSVDLANIDGTAPDCLKLATYPEEFTCLFPIGTQAVLQLGMAQDPTLQILINSDGGFQVQFHANPVQIH